MKWLEDYIARDATLESILKDYGKYIMNKVKNEAVEIQSKEWNKIQIDDDSTEIITKISNKIMNIKYKKIK